MRIVSQKNSRLHLPPATPQEAWRRGRVLDAMLPCTVALPHGVSRLTHAQRNFQDDARMLAVARTLNTAPMPHVQR